MIAEGSEYEKKIVTAGKHPAYCFGLIGVGREETKFGTYNFVRLLFEFPLETYQSENGDSNVVVMSEKFTLTMGSVSRKSNLAAFLEKWRGRAFTADEIKKFDLRNILGAPAIIDVSVNQGRNGSTYNKMDTVSRALRRADKSLFYPGAVPSEEMDFPEMFHEKLYFDAGNPDFSVIASLPKWIHRELQNNGVISAEQSQQEPSSPPAAASTPVDDDDDDLPF